MERHAGYPAPLRRLQSRRQQRLLSLGGDVYSLAFSPDGRWIFAGSGRVDNGKSVGEVHRWGAKTGERLSVTKVHDERVSALALSPDGKLLATGSMDRVAKLWDPKTGNLVRTLRGAGQQVNALVFSPDGQTLAAGTFQEEGVRSYGAVKLWDVPSGTEKRSLTGYRGLGPAVAVSPDGKLLAAPTTGNVVTLWELASGRVVERFKGPRGTVFDVAFSPRVAGWPQPGASSKTAVRSVARSACGRCPLGLLYPSLEYAFVGFTALAFDATGKRLTTIGVTTGKAEGRGETQMWELPRGHVRKADVR